MNPEDYASGFREVLRQIYLRRSTGRISFDDGDDHYFFHEGELYLSGDHPLAAQVRERLGAVAPGGRSAADEPLRKLTMSLVAPALGRPGTLRFDGGREGFPRTPVGPLPTVSAVLETSVHEADETQLTDRLGGKNARYQNSADSPALQQLPGLEPEMVQLMAHLERPTAVSQLLQLNPGRRFETLRALAKLRSIGLAKSDDHPSTTRGRRARRRENVRAEKKETRLVSARALELFSERIAEDLERNPVTLSPEDHRRLAAGWFRGLGEKTHYELLGLGPRCGDEELHRNFQDKARYAHPVHVQALGLQGRGEALRMLFERITEAYLTLSDPRRRASYDLLVGTPVEEEVIDAEKRQEEKQRMASACYQNALHYLSDHVRDYSQAVGLLKEAVRLDPRQPSYYSMLAQAQSQNPRWLDDAAESYLQALALDPKNAGFHVGLAELRVRQGNAQEARKHFRAALDDMPNHPAALVGLERLGPENTFKEAGAKLGGGLRSFFKTDDKTSDGGR